jgi:hypothetical protein
MSDHSARASEMRIRAARCQASAKMTTSVKFAECYRLAAENYEVLAKLEQDFEDRQIAHPENRYIPG